MIKTDCLKCGAPIPEYEQNNDDIKASLCADCLKIWKEFHRKYGSSIENEYKRGKNNHHQSWSVFIGELPNIWDKDVARIRRRERVQFT